MKGVGRVIILGVIGLALLGLLVFIVTEPFLDLPPIWQQLAIGIVLTGYMGWLMFGIAVLNRRWWPLKWRLKRAPRQRVQLIEQFIDFTWGIEH